MIRKKLNRKGSLLDVIGIIVILLFFGMLLLIGSKVTGEFNTQIQGMSTIPTEAKTASTQLNDHYAGALDNGFLFLTIGLSLVTFVLAALVRVHPIFIPFFFIGLLIVIILAGVFSNIYQEMAENPLLTANADNLTLTSHVLTYLPFIVGILGILLMIVMYKLWSVNQ